MDDLLQQLENRIKDLIQEHHELKQTTVSLQHGKQMLNREKDLLQDQQKKAISQIETLISRLKAIETLS